MCTKIKKQNNNKKTSQVQQYLAINFANENLCEILQDLWETKTYLNFPITCNLLKIGPPSKISPPLFSELSCCKGSFSPKSTPTHLCCSTYSYGKQEAPFAVVAWATPYDNRGIAKSLHAYITRARLTACEVGVKYHNSRKYAHSPLWRAT